MAPPLDIAGLRPLDESDQEPTSDANAFGVQPRGQTAPPLNSEGLTPIDATPPPRFRNAIPTPAPPSKPAKDGFLDTAGRFSGEFGRGIVRGASNLAGSVFKGAAALQTAASRDMVRFIDRQTDVLDRLERGETVDPSDDFRDYRSLTPAQRQSERARLQQNRQRLDLPGPATERDLFEAGRFVSEAGRGAFPVAPDFEGSTTAALGEGVGSVVAGIPAAALGPGGAALVFGAAGSGEALERAVANNASDDEQLMAALLGIGPGTTDVVPLEVLMGRLRIPVPLRGPISRAIGRIGGQAFIEGLQEGGQRFLQNLIAREIHQPGQDLSEGVVPEASLGAGVGGIAGTAREFLRLLAGGGRRVRGSQTAPEAEQTIAEPAQPDRARSEAPILTDDNVPFREIDRAPQAPRSAQQLSGLDTSQLRPVGEAPFFALNDTASRLAFGGSGQATRRPQRPSDRTELEADASRLTQDVRRFEDGLRASGAPPDQIAADIMRRFGFEVSPNEIASGRVWWRVQEERERESGRTAGGRFAPLRLPAEAETKIRGEWRNLSNAQVSARLNDEFGVDASLSAISNARDRLGAPARDRRLLPSQVEDALRSPRLGRMSFAAAASEINQRFGVDISANAVRLWRQRRGLNDVNVEEILRSDSFRNLSNAKAATALRQQFGVAIDAGQIGRERQAQGLATGNRGITTVPRQQIAERLQLDQFRGLTNEQAATQLRQEGLPASRATVGRIRSEIGTARPVQRFQSQSEGGEELRAALLSEEGQALSHAQAAERFGRTVDQIRNARRGLGLARGTPDRTVNQWRGAPTDFLLSAEGRSLNHTSVAAELNRRIPGASFTREGVRSRRNELGLTRDTTAPDVDALLVQPEFSGTRDPPLNRDQMALIVRRASRQLSDTRLARLIGQRFGKEVSANDVADIRQRLRTASRQSGQEPLFALTSDELARQKDQLARQWGEAARRQAETQDAEPGLGDIWEGIRSFRDRPSRTVAGGMRPINWQHANIRNSLQGRGRAPSSRGDFTWPPQALQMLRAAEGRQTFDAIAAALSDRFRRLVTRSMVAGKVKRLRDTSNRPLADEAWRAAKAQEITRVLTESPSLTSVEIAEYLSAFSARRVRASDVEATISTQGLRRRSQSAASEPMLARRGDDPESWFAQFTRSRDARARDSEATRQQVAPQSGEPAGRGPGTGTVAGLGQGRAGASRTGASVERFELGQFRGLVVETPNVSGLKQRRYFLYPPTSPLPPLQRPPHVIQRILRSSRHWVAKAHVSETAPGEWQVLGINVRRNRQRRGLGGALYDRLSTDLGVELGPSPAITRQLFRFWERRAPETVSDYQRIGDTYYAPETLRALKRVNDEILRDPTSARERAQAAREADEIEEALANVNGAPEAAFGNDVEVRPIIGAFLRQGRSVRIAQDAIDQINDVIEANASAIPEGTQAGALSKVEPLRGEPSYAGADTLATFTKPDGATFQLEVPWSLLRGARAFYDIFTDSIVVTRFGTFGTTERFGRTIAGEIHHETVHSLRRKGLLRGAAWDRLVNHSNQLRLLDSDARTYLQMVGDPSADKVAAGTVREAYERIYKDTTDLTERMDQEAVAHMVELYSHGELLAQQADPVRELLDSILKGQVRASTQVLDSSTLRPLEGPEASPGESVFALGDSDGDGTQRARPPPLPSSQTGNALLRLPSIAPPGSGRPPLPGGPPPLAPSRPPPVPPGSGGPPPITPQSPRAAITPPDPAIVRALDSYRTRFLEFWQNSQERMRVLVDRVGQGQLPDTADPYLRSTLYDGRISARVRRGNDLAQEIVQDVARLARSSRVDHETMRGLVNDYLIARHAPERNGVLGEGAAGITTADARQLLNQINARPDAAEIRALGQRIADFHDLSLDALRDSQVISQQLFQQLRTTYQHHVPLNRIIPDAPDVGNGIAGRGFDVYSSGVRRARGSNLEVNDILGNVLANFEQSILRAEKNLVDLSSLAFLRRHASDLAGLMREDRPRVIGQGNGGQPIFEQTSDPRVLHLFESGRQVWIRFSDSRLAAAFRGTNRDAMPGAVRFVATFTRLYSGLQTRFNPEFALPNKMRDLQEAIVYMGSQRNIGLRGAARTVAHDASSVKSVTDFIAGRNTPGARLYGEMIEAGGTTGGLGLSTREQVTINVERLDRLAQSTPRRFAQGVIELVDHWNTIFEDSSRLSIYRAARERGLSQERAAFLAKEGTVNFNRMGTAGPIVNSLYMFANASIQGSAKMIRSLRNPKVAATVGIVVAAAVVAVSEWNDEIDPDWREKVSKWDRLNSLPIVLPNDDGEGVRYVSLPVSWGLKPLMVAAAVAYDAMKVGAVDMGQAVSDILTAIIEGYNPAGGTDVWQALMPTIGDTPLDIARNRKWSGGRIRPDFDPNLPADKQFFLSLKDTQSGRAAIRTTEALRTYTGIEISPADVRYGVEQYLGGAGRAVRKTADVIMGVAGNDPPPKDEYPFLSRFYRERTGEEVGQRGSGDIEDIRARLSQQSRERFDLRSRADDVVRSLEGATSGQRRAVLSDLMRQDRGLAEAVKDDLEAKDRGLTFVERQILKLGVESGERARYIADTLRPMSEADRKASLADLARKKILTLRVRGQVLKLLRNSPPEGGRGLDTSRLRPLDTSTLRPLGPAPPGDQSSLGSQSTGQLLSLARLGKRGGPKTIGTTNETHSEDGGFLKIPENTGV